MSNTDQRAFKAALKRCGLADEACGKFAAEAVDTAQNLALVDKKEIEDLIKSFRESTFEVKTGTETAPVMTKQIYMTMVQGRKVLGLHCWSFCQDVMRSAVDVSKFIGATTTAGDQNLIKRWSQRAQFHAQSLRKAKNSPPEKPPKFTSMAKWRGFSEGMSIYLSQVRSQHISSAPLAYLMRPNKKPTAEDLGKTFDTIDDMLIACIDLEHHTVKQEDIDTFHVLAEATRGADAWTIVKKYQRKPSFINGWDDLLLQAEGPEAKTLQKAQARASIGRAKYTGRSNFTFQRHTAIFMAAFIELERLKEPYHESQKVTHFIKGISCQQLDTCIKLVKKDPKYNEDWMKCQQCLNSCVEDEKLDTGNRKVAGVKHKPHDNNACNNKFKKLRTTRRLPANEWFALEKSERDKITALRNQEKAKKKQAAEETKIAAAAVAKVTPPPQADFEIPPEALIKALNRLAKDKAGQDGHKQITFTVSSVGSQSTPMEIDDGDDGNKKPPAKDAGKQFGRKGKNKSE